MAFKRTPAWLALALGTGMAIGCQSGADHHSYSDDPVLLSKKPVDGKPDPAGSSPILLAHAEPMEPAMPATALAAAPAITTPPAIATPPAMAQAPTPAPALPSVEPAPVMDAVPTLTPAHLPVPTRTAVLRHVDGTYAHAADYGWLQGVIDRHYLGYLTLRYCDYSADDRWGGKVILDEDPRLASLHDGDLVQVEGDLVAGSTAAADQPWDHYPHYRIRMLQLIKRANP